MIFFVALLKPKKPACRSGRRDLARIIASRTLGRGHLLFAVFSFLFLTLALGAQDSRTNSLSLSEVLAKFPAASGAERDELAAEIVSLGPRGLEAVCRQLAAPGTDDDNLVRFALDAVAVTVTRSGAEDERRMFVAELLRPLEPPGNWEVKAFLIDELRLAGRDEIVRPLSRFLKDPRLCGPAARALVTVGTEESKNSLLSALSGAPPAAALSIIQSLGELRSAGAVGRIIPYAASKNESLRRAALTALAQIGDPAAQPALEKQAVTASPYERARAANLYLAYARRLWERGERETSEKICREFIQNTTLPRESQIRSSALNLLAEISGPTILDALLDAAESADRSFRQSALALADSTPGEDATQRWIEKMADVPPANQADIIRMLGRRGDRTALPAVREKIKSDDKSVRLAAIASLPRLAGEDALEDLWPLIQTDDEDQAAAVRTALSLFPSDRIVERAASLISEVPPPARAALIEILAERQASAYAGLVLEQASSGGDEVRKAALAALPSLARAEDVPGIVDLLLAASAAPEVTALQNALVSAALLSPEPEKRADAILAALQSAEGSKRANLLRPLARIGGAEALRVVVNDAKSEDPQLRTVAISTLSSWRDVRAMGALFEIARGASDPKFRYLALQGVARLSGDSSLSDRERLSYLGSALELAVEKGEKNVVISALGGVKTSDSLALAAEFLGDPAQQTRAAQTILRTALPSVGAEGLSGFETACVLKRAALFIEDEYDRGQAEKYSRDLLLKEGFVALFDGKSLAGWKGLVADPPRRARMSAGESAKAQAEANRLMRAHWKVVDGTLVFDGKDQSLCTSKDYSDFELFVDWKIEPKGDSGIYLRGSPQVQIWDPAVSPEGSGGLYNNNINAAKPLERADRPVGEWNNFYIKMAGERVTVVLNGVLVVDNVTMENYWEREKPIYATGQIELQAHTTPVYFKNIFIREK